ncbi:tripartite motif-containing 16-like protein [Labeo rohita]|uniref:Tripartite motif-containing 16-like protein n=1 Tax=Labeo rohita TaxID=84645 RepID=A0A498P1X7_LABRO|nr:tripartite motif-containing 16-like protein [Labeo rohita]
MSVNNKQPEYSEKCQMSMLQTVQNQRPKMIFCSSCQSVSVLPTFEGGITQHTHLFFKDISISMFKEVLEDVCQQQTARIFREVSNVYVTNRPEPKTKNDFLQCAGADTASTNAAAGEVLPEESQKTEEDHADKPLQTKQTLQKDESLQSNKLPQTEESPKTEEEHVDKPLKTKQTLQKDESPKTEEDHVDKPLQMKQTLQKDESPKTEKCLQTDKSQQPDKSLETDEPLQTEKSPKPDEDHVDKPLQTKKTLQKDESLQTNELPQKKNLQRQRNVCKQTNLNSQTNL